MQTYSFIYRGKIKEGQRLSDVRHRLAKLFSVETSDIDPLLSDHAHFQRNNLDELTAKLYQENFLHAGAVGEIILSDQTEPKPEVEQPTQHANEPLTQCPKCQSESIDEERCLNCGIYFKKYFARHNQNTSAPSKDVSRLLVETKLNDAPDPQGKSTARWLTWSSLAIIIIVSADSYLQSSAILFRSGIDIGYVPLILAHFALLRGCFLFTKLKGLPPHYGFLGCLSLLGVSILVLLPGKNSPNNNLTFRKLSLAALSAGMFFYWVSNFLDQTKVSGEIESEAVFLAQGRQEFPTNVLQSDNGVYEEEQTEIREFINNTLDSLENQSFRPDHISALANQMFSELARYEIWRNYQRYLHINAQRQLPARLSKEATEADRRFLSNLLETRITRTSNSRLVDAKNNWLIGRIPDEMSQFWLSFDSYVGRLYDAYRNAHFNAMAEREDPTSEPVRTIHLENARFSTFANTTMKVEASHIEISATEGELAKAPLAIGFYLEPYLDRKGRTQYRPTMIMLSTEFPYDNFHGMSNVFQSYSNLRHQF